jgi:hypothetical protein
MKTLKDLCVSQIATKIGVFQDKQLKFDVIKYLPADVKEEVLREAAKQEPPKKYTGSYYNWTF